MLKGYNRDIIVVSARALNDEQAFNHEVNMLKDLLYKVEDIYHIAKSTEIFDLKRYKIVRKRDWVVRHLCDHQTRPFVFISNRN